MPNEYQFKKIYIFISKHHLTLKICKGWWKKSRISDKKAEFSNQQFLSCSSKTISGNQMEKLTN